MNIYSLKTPKNIEKLDEEILKVVNKYSLFKRKNDYKMYCSFTHIFD
jgi:septum formation topological specificity factor MinE